MLDAHRRACLQAIGIELWQPREDGDSSGESLLVVAPDEPARAEEPVQSVVVADDKPQSVPAAAPKQSARSEQPADKPPRPAPPPSTGDAGVFELGWDALTSRVNRCTDCDLHQTRTQTVFGVGDRKARLLIIGEAPGADEDRQGEPFVGRAGQLLNAMLEAIGFSREQVYIANIIKCRPPGNRDPHADEAAACSDYLQRQIELIGPAMILSIGRVSAHHLLNTEEAVGRMRGKIHRYQPGDIPLVVTYHPAYLLRRPTEKAKSWQDLQRAWQVLQES